MARPSFAHIETPLRLYGDGEISFSRLREIIVAWTNGETAWTLPPSPAVEAAEAFGKMLEAVCERTHWTEAEARNFVSSIAAESPEKLFEDLDAAIDIAVKAEAIAAAADVMKAMGSVLDVRVVDGELTLRIRPDVSVTMHDDGVDGTRVNVTPTATA